MLGSFPLRLFNFRVYLTCCFKGNELFIIVPDLFFHSITLNLLANFNHEGFPIF